LRRVEADLATASHHQQHPILVAECRRLIVGFAVLLNGRGH
jgi:hypothetical protein